MKIRGSDNWRSHMSLLGCSGPSLFPVFTSTFHSCFPQEGLLSFSFFDHSPCELFWLTPQLSMLQTSSKYRLFCLSQCDKLSSFNNCLFDTSCSIKRFPNVTFPHTWAFACLPLLDQWLCQVKKWRAEWRTRQCGLRGRYFRNDISDSLFFQLSPATRV